MLKNKFIYILAIVLLLGVGALVYFFLIKPGLEEAPSLPVPEEKTMEEILKDLTAPAGERPEVSEEVIKSLTAPPK